MKIIAVIALILSFLGGGVARLALAFLQGRGASEASSSRTGLLIIALLNIVVSTAGMICLLLGIVGPWQILGALVITNVVEIIIRARYGAKFL